MTPAFPRSAGFFGPKLIQEFAHGMENLLMCVRDGKLDYHSEMTRPPAGEAPASRLKEEVAAAWGLGCRTEAS